MNASVIHGRMNLPSAIDCQIDAPIVSPMRAHPTPNHSSNLNQKKYRSSWPSQNTGIETPISAKSMPARSQNDPRLTPETMPIGIPRASQMTAAPMASVIVTGSRRRDLSFTGTKLP